MGAAASTASALVTVAAREAQAHARATANLGQGGAILAAQEARGAAQLAHGMALLAQDAFVTVDGPTVATTYKDDELQVFYDSYLKYLDTAQIKWVSVGYLRQLAKEAKAMTRCQDVPEDQCVVGSKGFPRKREMKKHRWVLSHPWLSKDHPDPSGAKLQALVGELDAQGAPDTDAVFIDYMSLPQNNKLDPDLKRIEARGERPGPGEHPAMRSVEEEERFKVALKSMQFIYSVGKTPVIVLPMDELLPSGQTYITRGWCFFEFCLAVSFGNVVKCKNIGEVEILAKQVKDKEAFQPAGFREAFKATRFTQKGDADTVLKLFEDTCDMKAPKRDDKASRDHSPSRPSRSSSRPSKSSRPSQHRR